MKRFLLSLVALVTFSATAFAVSGEPDDPCRPPPSPSEVVVETVDESVSATLDTALQYVENVIQPIMWEVGPQADAVIFDLQIMTMTLNSQDIELTELLALSDEAEENYREARELFTRGMVYVQLADIFAEEAEEYEGVVAYTLRTRAAAYYYRAAIYVEQSRTALDTVLEIGKKAEVLVSKLTSPA